MKILGILFAIWFDTVDKTFATDTQTATRARSVGVVTVFAAAAGTALPLVGWNIHARLQHKSVDEDFMIARVAPIPSLRS